MTRRTKIIIGVALLIAALPAGIYSRHVLHPVPKTFDDSMRAVLDDTSILNHSEIKPEDSLDQTHRQ